MHNCICITHWHDIIIATIYKPSHRVKKLMGHGSTPSDPWPMWPIPFSWPIWPMTHDPSTHSLLWYEHNFTFNVNYKIAVTCCKLHWQFDKMFGESYKWTFISEHVFRVSHMISDGHATGQSQHRWSKSNRVCIKRFSRSLISYVFVSYMRRCTTPQISKLRHVMTLVHSDEAMMHLMQFSLVRSRCNVTFSVLWFSQGSVATLLRWGALSSYLTCAVHF